MYLIRWQKVIKFNIKPDKTFFLTYVIKLKQGTSLLDSTINKMAAGIEVTHEFSMKTSTHQGPPSYSQCWMSGRTAAETLNMAPFLTDGRPATW